LQESTKPRLVWAVDSLKLTERSAFLLLSHTILVIEKNNSD
jgi:hypothetical protein